MSDLVHTLVEWGPFAGHVSFILATLSMCQSIRTHFALRRLRRQRQVLIRETEAAMDEVDRMLRSAGLPHFERPTRGGRPHDR